MGQHYRRTKDRRERDKLISVSTKQERHTMNDRSCAIHLYDAAWAQEGACFIDTRLALDT